MLRNLHQITVHSVFNVIKTRLIYSPVESLKIVDFIMKYILYCTLIRSYVKIQKGEIWSYLPFLQYDATLFGYHNTQKLEEVILSFHLRSSLSFPTMGVFYLRNPRSSTGLCQLIGNCNNYYYYIFENLP